MCQGDRRNIVLRDRQGMEKIGESLCVHQPVLKR